MWTLSIKNTLRGRKLESAITKKSVESKINEKALSVIAPAVGTTHYEPFKIVNCPRAYRLSSKTVMP